MHLYRTHITNFGLENSEKEMLNNLKFVAAKFNLNFAFLLLFIGLSKDKNIHGI